MGETGDDLGVAGVYRQGQENAIKADRQLQNGFIAP